MNLVYLFQGENFEEKEVVRWNHKSTTEEYGSFEMQELQATEPMFEILCLFSTVW